MDGRRGGGFWLLRVVAAGLANGCETRRRLGLAKLVRAGLGRLVGDCRNGAETHDLEVSKLQGGSLDTEPELVVLRGRKDGPQIGWNEICV